MQRSIPHLKVCTAGNFEGFGVWVKWFLLGMEAAIDYGGGSGRRASYSSDDEVMYEGDLLLLLLAAAICAEAPY